MPSGTPPPRLRAPMLGSLGAHLVIAAALAGAWGAGAAGDERRAPPVIQVVAATPPAALAQGLQPLPVWAPPAPSQPHVQEADEEWRAPVEEIVCSIHDPAEMPELRIDAGAPLPQPLPGAQLPVPASAPAVAPPEAAPAPRRLAARVDDATCPTPAYPPLARRRGLEGLTVLLLQVGADGSVTSARVAESSGHAILDEAALAAVHAWRLTPATEEGRPVADALRVPLRFRLER